MGRVRPAAIRLNWVNQELVLYHGTIDTHTNSVLSGVDVTRGRQDTDFGRGFYTTTWLIQAQGWALDTSWRNPGTAPVVIWFRVSRDALADLQSLWFVRGAPNANDYWSFVSYSRSGGASHGRAAHSQWYDAVIGLVSRRWQRRLAYPDLDQISFHTSAGAGLLDASPKGVMP